MCCTVCVLVYTSVYGVNNFIVHRNSHGLYQLYRHNEDDIDLLFQLLRVYNTRQVLSLHFLSRFLENSVIKVNSDDNTLDLYEHLCYIQNPSLSYKRKVFFKFVEVFQDTYYLQELKAKILQHIILPLFAYSFEEGKVDEVSIQILVFCVRILKFVWVSISLLCRQCFINKKFRR